MYIGINTRFLIREKLEGFGVYTDEIVQRLVQAHPDDRFRCYFDRAVDQRFRYGPNMEPVSLWPPARHPLLYRLWYDVRLKADLRRHRPDVFFSPDGYMPTGSGVPVVLTVHDVAPRRFPDHLTRMHRRYYLHHMPRYLEQAAHIITVSEFSRREIMHWYRIPEAKISVIHNGVSSGFAPLSPADQQATRRKLTGGKPYLLYVGAIHPRKNVEALVRAFDIFKHTTNNDVQLIIAGARSWKTSSVSEAINAAEYQEEIHQVGYVAEGDLPAMIGGALAMCYVSLYEGFGMPVLEAMASGVPVLTSSADSTGAALAEVAGEAGIQVDPQSEEEIAAGMARIAGDRPLRQALIEAGIHRARMFSWDTAAQKTYDVLRRLAGMETIGKL
ncbi:MAG: glycosyltransferase family 1 protein [Saprospiraceae bacterium]|nr:glycosyltransferase family 1 protein [Saprospiraceae bacterium]